MTATAVNIVNGPSREELFDALRLRHEVRGVKFTLEAYGGLRISVLVNGIEVEDGSGNSWTLLLHDDKEVFRTPKLKAYFNTTKRIGWIRPA